MEEQAEIRLSWKDMQKLRVLEEVRGGSRSQASAAKTLGVTDRWIRKLIKRLSRQGAVGLVHGNRNRVPRNRIEDARREQIVRLYRERYGGFNLLHFGEMLQRQEGIQAPSRESLRRILTASGDWTARRKAPKHHQRRPRREHEGELLQIDGSLHRWFGGDQPLITLVAAIDDATSDVPGALFVPAETTEAYFGVLQQILRNRGIPRSIYGDRHGVFQINNAKELDLLKAQGKEALTQFGRALKELEVEWIPAYSPQAKGRIERLWGTFQDRLQNELQLHKIRTLDEANRYLPGFLRTHNRHFRHPPARPDRVYRPTPPRHRLEGILCWKERRILARDHTFSWEGQPWQVLPCEQIPALSGKTIEVRRLLRGGDLQAWIGSIRLKIRPAPLARPQPGVKASRAAAAPSDYRVRGKVRIRA